MDEAQVTPNDSSTAVMTTSSSVTRVDPSILPPEVTDQIIDNLCGDSEALRQCALTCRAWRPRSQLCLIQDVTIGSRTGLKAFAAHLRGARCMSYPHSLCLAQCNDSTMKAEHQFVHLVPLVLPQVLESVKVIVIERINWDYFPPHPTFRFIATQFPHVVSLTLRDCSFCSLKELYTILSAFPSLLDLYLMNISGTNISTPPAPTIHPRMRARLKELHLHVFVPEVSRSMLEFLTHCQCLESLRDLHLFAPIADEATMRKLNQAIGPCLESLHFSGMDRAKLLTTCTRLHTLWVSLATPDTLVDQLSSMVSHDLRKLEIYASTGGNNLDEMLLQWHRLDDVLTHERFALLTTVMLEWRWVQLNDGVEPDAWAERFLERLPKLRSRRIVQVVSDTQPMRTLCKEVASERIATTGRPEGTSATEWVWQGVTMHWQLEMSSTYLPYHL